MIIVKDERQAKFRGMGTCEHCKQWKEGRRVDTYDAAIQGRSRGWWFLCFGCFGPRIFWRQSEKGKLYESPAPQDT